MTRNAHRKLISATDPGQTNIELLLKAKDYLQKRKIREPLAESTSHEAWKRFHQIYSPVIEGFARSCGVSRSDVADCAQEVWVAVCKELPSLQYNPNRGRFRGWLYTVVHRRAVDLIRKRTRQPKERLQKVIDSGREPRGHEPSPDQEFERRWLQEVVRSMMSHLQRRVSESNFRVIQMRSIEGQSVEEVSRALNIAPGRVRVMHFRMKEKLRALIRENTGCDFGADVVGKS